MNRNNYLSSNQLIEKARDKIVPIPSQINAQKELATLISLHLNNIIAIDNGVPADELVSLSSFIVGGTGSGKSHIAQNLAKVCNLNFERVDCANITSSGYKGRNINTVLSGILEKKPNWFEEGGVILWDECDKLRDRGFLAYDVYSPVKDFLVLLEKGDYTFTTENKQSVTINLDKTMFLFSGACAQITPLLEKKHKREKHLGFSLEPNDHPDETCDLLSLISLQDLIDYGFMPEFIGRLKKCIYIPPITLEGYQLLVGDSTAKTSVINKYQHIFETRGVEFEITSNARKLIAQKALKEGLGARSIEAVMSSVVIEAHNHIDSAIDCNKVILSTTKEGNFSLKYHKGNRSQKPCMKEKRLLSDDELDISITRKIDSKLKRQGFCRNICETANLQDKQQEELLYSFLYTVCYYLSNAVRPHERTYLNLMKLAKATVNSKEVCASTITPFEIICNDYTAKVHSESEQLSFEDEFLPFYLQFKKLSYGANLSKQLVEPLHLTLGAVIKPTSLVREII